MDHPTSLLLSALAGGLFLTALLIGVFITMRLRSHRDLDPGRVSQQWLTQDALRR